MKTFPSSTASQTCPSRSFVALTVSMVTLPQSMSIASGGGGLRNLDCRKSTGCGAAWLSALDWGSRGPGFKSRQPDSKSPGQQGCVIGERFRIFRPKALLLTGC